MPKKTHPISELEAKMDPEVLAKAKKMAKQESLNIRLSLLREKYGLKQSEITNFTQTAVSKLENRKDIRISTLIDYLESLGVCRTYKEIYKKTKEMIYFNNERKIFEYRQGNANVVSRRHEGMASIQSSGTFYYRSSKPDRGKRLQSKQPR